MINDITYSGVTKLARQGGGQRKVCLKSSVISVPSVVEN